LPRILRNNNAASKRATEKAKIGDSGNSGTRVLVVEVIDLVVDDVVDVTVDVEGMLLEVEVVVPSSSMGLSLKWMGLPWDSWCVAPLRSRYWMKELDGVYDTLLELESAHNMSSWYPCALVIPHVQRELESAQGPSNVAPASQAYVCA